MGKKSYEQVILTIVELREEDVFTKASMEAWDVGGNDVYGELFGG